jgi:hypothetical protein
MGQNDESHVECKIEGFKTPALFSLSKYQAYIQQAFGALHFENGVKRGGGGRSTGWTDSERSCCGVEYWMSV